MKKADAINLLPEISKFKASRQLLIKKLNKYAIFMVSFLIIVVIVIFGYQFYLRRSKNRLVKSKQSLNQSIEQFSYHLELQQRLRFRLKMVSELLDSRIDNSDELNNLASFLPADVRSEGIKISSRTTEFKGEVDNLVQVRELEDKIGLARKDGNYKDINLDFLSKEITGWSFQLILRK